MIKIFFAMKETGTSKAIYWIKGVNFILIIILLPFSPFSLVYTRVDKEGYTSLSLYHYFDLVSFLACGASRRGISYALFLSFVDVN